MTHNLFLHAGGAAIDRQQLAYVPTPAPTKSWHPIPHRQLLDSVVETLSGSGLEVVDESHGVARDGQRYFGILSVKSHRANPAAGEEQHATDGPDYGLVIGLRNSHDKSFPATLGVGSHVFICDNLAFSSEIVLARKHTANILRDLPQLLSRAVGQLSDHRGFQDRRIEAYKRTALDTDLVDHLIMESYRRRVINLQRIDDVWQEWSAPRHEEFFGRNAWSFFNAVTEVLKGTYFGLPQRTQALHGLLDEVAEVRLLPPTHRVVLP